LAESVAQLQRLVRHRAGDRCEYCRISAAIDEVSLQIERVAHRQHGGATVLENLALACQRCNAHKGPNLTGIDEETGTIERLFHPRQDRWQDHFAVRPDGTIAGITAAGRVTVALLSMNAGQRRRLRVASGL
jgi:5-methylcytosine-specific restriction endonuclease McrA